MTENISDKRNDMPLWLYLLGLGLILAVAIYFRTVGIYWGEEQYLHPDERFLVWVGSDISPVKSLSEYFDTAVSSLNPHNKGHGFFVYGTLPMFITRYLVEWIFGHSGFREMTLVGRPLSTLADVITVLFIAATALHLYGRRVSLLASAFYAMAVLPIQLSHFFKEDTFLNVFIFLAVYLAVRIVDEPDTDFLPPQESLPPEETLPSLRQELLQKIKSPLFSLSVGFGISFGCAMASKLTAYPLAFVIPAAFIIREIRLRQAGWRESSPRWFLHTALISLIAAGLVSILVFRLFQPYAFSGPGFFGVKPNQAWVDNITEQRNQSTGDVDFPPALQWARRPLWFSWQNLTLWGLGLPLGILAWAGFLWMGWRILRGEWQTHALLWGWTAFFFAWQSLQHNPTMRYQLPSYPGLTIIAAWAVIALWHHASRAVSPMNQEEQTVRPSLFIRLWNPKTARLTAILTAVLVLGLTAAWAFAFTRIYTRPVTRIAASRWIYQNVPAPISVQIKTGDATEANSVYNQPLPFPYDFAITPDNPYQTIFTAARSGSVEQITLGHALDVMNLRQPKTLQITLQKTAQPDQKIQASLTADFLPVTDPRGNAYVIRFETPFLLEQGQQYQLLFTLADNASASLALFGASPANESSWDDGLPLRMDGYDGYGGIYQPDLVFEMYWDDNPEKYSRFIATLDQADYIFISSNRQWGTVPRLPERYPLSTAYYRHLIGCPEQKDILWCYNVAKPGQFQGDLGFELVQVFESFPSIASLQINDQFAEEAFTVYDHPKVLIFKKSADYDPLQVRRILGAVDLSMAVHITPLKASKYPGTLMLPPDRLREQQSGGTWSELFHRSALFNRNQFIAVVYWYLALTLLGWMLYPLTRLIFISLDDRGFPLARITALLLLSFLVWFFGSFRVPFNRLTISAFALALALISAACAILNWDNLKAEWKQRKKQFILTEALFLAFFLFDLFIRLGNPDLWHPWKGGEKPMDFAYLNAVLKSTSFPPYDPWFAGGYLNYYYYGFVLVGVFIKWLGVIPAIAYNLVLPTIFSLIAMGAFSLVWNLIASRRASGGEPLNQPFTLEWLGGLSGALGMAVLGNLGTVRMIINGYQKLVAPDGIIEGVNFFTRLIWTLRGFLEALKGASLPYGLGDWYWIPSRAIPAPNDVEPITEFPFFTVLYGDPHAHLFALPLALLALSFALAFFVGKPRWNLPTVGRIIFGGLVVGALRPTNYSDFYPYLGLVAFFVVYNSFMGFLSPSGTDELPANSWKQQSMKVIRALAGAFLLWLSASLLYYPFTRWLGWGYSKISLWKGTHTPTTSYLVHWGLFLFILFSWMLWESLDWMAKTPLSALKKLKPYASLIVVALLLIPISCLALYFWLKVTITWLVLPLALWAGILGLRPDQSPAKCFVLVLTAAALLLTLMVEIVVVVGDIGRMNTVFKFYLQAWTMLAVSAAAALAWLLPALLKWQSPWRKAWFGLLAVLVFSASLYTLTASTAKIKDRMSEAAPITLDGMAYMATARYADTWGEMDLSQDYRAILWMQDNVKGSPVIVEANLRDLYRWGSRFSIYTGLPGVVGWEWHQQQQRTLFPGSWVSNRIDEIELFYRTPDLQTAVDFLRKYNVRYIIVGQQERGKYPGAGLDKFELADGQLWKSVYRDQQTVIYEVILP